MYGGGDRRPGYPPDQGQAPRCAPLDSHGLRALVTRTDRSSTRDTAVLEGALRCGVSPTSLASQCFHAATGWAEHRDLDCLACCLEISGDVEQVLSGAGHVVCFVCGYCTGSGVRRQPRRAGQRSVRWHPHQRGTTCKRHRRGAHTRSHTVRRRRQQDGKRAACRSPTHSPTHQRCRRRRVERPSWKSACDLVWYVAIVGHSPSL